MTHVLLVDDDPGIQRSYSKLLKDEGYEVYSAFNAEQATDIMISKPIDLVLLDIHMPGIDGTVMREVIDEYDSDLKVIVSSVYPLSEQKKKIKRAHEYFDKSHGAEWLLTLIHKVLERRTP